MFNGKIGLCSLTGGVSPIGIVGIKPKEYMVDVPKVRELSEEEKLEREYNDKKRELRIGRTRASLVKKQILEAYETLENIRFDYVSDTKFRDFIVGAKRELEGAINDFLLDDTYWKSAIEKHADITPKEYSESHGNVAVPN